MFRAFSLLALAAGALLLLGALALLGEGFGVPPEARRLRQLKDRVTVPAALQPITQAFVQALPHDLPVARRAALEARGVSLEGWNQRMMLAADGDVHLEITPTPRRPDGPDTTYVTAEVTPRWRLGHPGWSYERLLEVFRPNSGGATAWDSGPRRVRVSGWLLYDYQYDWRPSREALARGTRVSGWEIHPVTRIEAWDDAAGRWTEVAR